MHQPYVPRAPWHNPRLADGHHEAHVVQVSKHPYRNGQAYYWRILLAVGGELLATNIYVQPEACRKAGQRLWHLCKAAQCGTTAFMIDPTTLVGRRLTVELETVGTEKSGAKQAFSDVKRFLAAAPIKKRQLFELPSL